MSTKNHVAPSEDDWKQSKAKVLVAEEKQEKIKKFDEFYRTLGSQVIPEDKRIDYVLVYPYVDEKELEDPDDKAENERKEKIREKFELAMKDEGLMKQRMLIEDNVYTKIHCPFKRLCEEAEKVTLEMPLLGVSQKQGSHSSICPRFTDLWGSTQFL